MTGVGYDHLQTSQEGGAKMLGVPFTCIGATSEGFWLSDLTPQNYLDNSDIWYNKGVKGAFAITILNTQGYSEATYSWQHTVTRAGVWSDDARWLDNDNLVVVPHSENDHFFRFGAGFWANAPEKSPDDETAVYSFQSAGQVCTDSVRWVLSKIGGAVQLANPYPVSIYISDLTPQGYLDNSDIWYNKGVKGAIAITVLDKSGYSLATYSWQHTCTRAGVWSDDARWLDNDNLVVVPKSDNDLEITAGMGLWVNAPEHSPDDPDAEYYINVVYPGPAL